MFTFLLGLFVGGPLGLILVGVLHAARYGGDDKGTPSRKRPR
jgi:hypothetical protein